MALPPPGFPILDFATLIKDARSFFETMPRFVLPDYREKLPTTIYIPRKLRSPDAEQMRDDIERCRPEPVVITITITSRWIVENEPPDLPTLQERFDSLARRLDTARARRLS